VASVIRSEFFRAINTEADRSVTSGQDRSKLNVQLTTFLKIA
jgi:hypothetical protein